MKKLVICLVGVLALSLVSCGSQWEVSGNNITITRVETDTVVPAGTLIIQDTIPMD